VVDSQVAGLSRLPGYISFYNTNALCPHVFLPINLIEDHKKCAPVFTVALVGSLIDVNTRCKGVFVLAIQTP